MKAGATAVEATTVEATTVEATTVEATTVEATTVEATTVEERQPTPAPTPAGPSARGNLVVPVILIICIGLLTSWGLMWSNARLLDRNAQATTRHLANSMLAIEARVLRNLVAAMAGGHEAHAVLGKRHRLELHACDGVFERPEVMVDVAGVVSVAIDVLH